MTTASNKKTVADPIAEYESLFPLWNKSRAVCSGERFVKVYDKILDTLNYTNLLIPFSPSMTVAQYAFYKAEAELPGITAQFTKMLVGGLLRKKPTLTLPTSVPAEAQDWILNEFGQDDSTLLSFLDGALWEELQTSRVWIYVDYPRIENPSTLTREDFAAYKPYPVIWKAESIINWQVFSDLTGKTMLKRVITRGFETDFDADEFHPAQRETIRVHELDSTGKYQIRIYRIKDEAGQEPTVINGKKQVNKDTPKFELIETLTNILVNGERLNFIPAWPLNGNIEPVEPMLMPIIDKEVSLYNKISRRNHLLYGAATYTPVLSADITDEQFQEIVDGGLGQWIRLPAEGKASILETPTDALQDMDRAIANTIEDMAKMGLRMLSPEQAQSGVALEIRNAAQTAQLGTLNAKASSVLQQIIAFMLNWRYDLQLKASEIDFSLTSDFNPTPLGADWLRLVTEWYEKGLIPRTIWLEILKQNDIMPPEYDDKEGQLEINDDPLLMPRGNESNDIKGGVDN